MFQMKSNCDNFHKIILFVFFVFATQVSLAQKDTLVMKPLENVMGEIKKLDEGIIHIETDYSDNDFDKIMYINTVHSFLILTAKGERYYGTIQTKRSDSLKVEITEKTGNIVDVNLKDLVFFQEIEDSFWKRLDVL